MNQFVDVVSFEVEGGHGGAGSTSFRREPYVPLGGPDGGNGGNGGNVVVVVDARVTSFGKIKSRNKFRAKDGDVGTGRLSDGKSGEDCVLRVPVGTVLYNEEDNTIIKDLVENNESVIIAKGGKGGKGNKFYATATNQAPDYAQHGLSGEKLAIRLEIKLIADIGFVGLPNAGKSSLLARLTRAKPKIAAYPFTTLTPNLGVCYLDIERNLIVADIPGIIEGAHLGIGLGHTFLRHIERTGALALIIDITDEDIFAVYNELINELSLYSEEMTKKKFIIILNKIDMIDEEEIKEKTEYLKKNIGSDVTIFPMSVFASTDEEIHNISESLYSITRKDEEILKQKEKSTIIQTRTADEKTSRRVFGPIRSKRLGKSLGIDVTPHKTCSYDCVYCSLGANDKTTLNAKNFYSVEAIIFELQSELHKHKNINYITISGSGEPTLYSNLKKLILEIKNITEIPLSIITNGSTLYKQEVRSSLLGLDIVIPSLDAGNKAAFNKINHPHNSIEFDEMVQGLFDFKKVFKGEIWLEVFIVKGINDSDCEIKDIADIANKLNPTKVQLVTSTRRVAYEGIEGIGHEDLIRLSKFFTCDVEVPELHNQSGNPKTTKIITEEDVYESLVRHPETAEMIALGFDVDIEVVKNILDELVKKARVRVNTLNGKKIYTDSFN